jgi:hypothetical protein
LEILRRRLRWDLTGTGQADVRRWDAFSVVIMEAGPSTTMSGVAKAQFIAIIIIYCV